MQEMKLLITVANEVELGMITVILKKNEVPFLTKDKGPGNYMRVYTGTSIWGTDILVNEADFDKATDLIANFREENAEEL
ncbi:MAG: DUF2007 domain-containing protein [Lachnospiraceae bacterium]